MNHRFSIFADYFQVYLQDLDHWEDFSADWANPRVCDDLYIVKNHGLVFVTARNVEVPVLVRTEDHPYELDDWDHLIECSIELKSGTFILKGPTDDEKIAPRVTLDPGVYRVRVLFAGLNEISEDGLNGEDRYEIHIWSGPLKPSEVIKQGSS